MVGVRLLSRVQYRMLIVAAYCLVCDIFSLIT